MTTTPDAPREHGAGQPQDPPVADPGFDPGSTMRRLYPESNVGGFSQVNGEIEFYTRVGALVGPSSRVLDVGAGRGWWAVEPTPAVARAVRMLRGRVREVVGVDVDDAVLTNPSLDVAHVVGAGERLPFDDASFDLVVADYVLEHVDADDAESFAADVMRVLRPGGWFAARTPNKWGFIGVGARAVPNALHVRLLRRLQPDRIDVDVFPVRYAMNTRRTLQRQFAGHEVVVYTHVSEPGYVGRSIWAWRLMMLLDRVTPRRLAPTLMVFVRRAP